MTCPQSPIINGPFEQSYELIRTLTTTAFTNFFHEMCQDKKHIDPVSRSKHDEARSGNHCAQ